MYPLCCSFSSSWPRSAKPLDYGRRLRLEKWTYTRYRRLFWDFGFDLWSRTIWFKTICSRTIWFKTIWSRTIWSWTINNLKVINIYSRTIFEMHTASWACLLYSWSSMLFKWSWSIFNLEYFFMLINVPEPWSWTISRGQNLKKGYRSRKRKLKSFYWVSWKTHVTHCAYGRFLLWCLLSGG